MKVVFLGATKGMGRALARRMAARGEQLFLLGRNIDELERSSQDFALRGSGVPSMGYHPCDLEHPEGFDVALDAADTALGGFDTVVVTAGLFATKEELERDPALLARILTVNFTNTVLFCENARKRLLERGGGTLCVFSSVAGDRGRRPVVLYGAAKAGLSAYLEGLDHRDRVKGLRTVCVKPGFVRTSMTSGLKPPPFAGEPDDVAERVLAAIERGTPVVYAPWIWGVIMSVIRRLPRFVMRKAEF